MTVDSHVHCTEDAIMYMYVNNRVVIKFDKLLSVIVEGAKNLSILNWQTKDQLTHVYWQTIDTSVPMNDVFVGSIIGMGKLYFDISLLSSDKPVVEYMNHVNIAFKEMQHPLFLYAELPGSLEDPESIGH